MVVGGIYFEAEGGKLGAEAVVEVAADAAAFFFAGGDELLTGALQVVGEMGGVNGRSCLPRHIFQQPCFRRIKRLARRTGGNQKLADEGGLIGEGESVGRGVWCVG